MIAATPRAAGAILLGLICGLVQAQTGALASAPGGAAPIEVVAASGAAAVDSPFTLQGDKSPTKTPWTEPASINLTRSQGKTVGTFDGYLTWTPPLPEGWTTPSDCVAGKSGIAVSAYWHKDTDTNSLKDDRGIELKYSTTVNSNAFSDIAADMKTVCAKPGVTKDEAHAAAAAAMARQNEIGTAGGNDWNWGWSAGVQGGKTLTATNPKSSPSTPKTYYDKDKDRETATIGGYYGFILGLPPLPGPDGQDAKSSTLPKVAYAKWTAGLYSDNATGGQGPSGRLSGAQVSLTGTIYPVGLETTWAIGTKSLVPSFSAAAQVEKDVTATGSRPKSTYRLYSVGMTIEATKGGKSNGDIVPSLTLKRSTGADLLTGRANSAKTELSFGLTF